MKLKRLNSKGAIALTTMIIVGAVVSIMVSTMVFTGLSSRSNAFNISQAEKLFVETDGCFEEALIRLKRNDAYTGSIFTVGTSDCNVSVSGSDDTRTITIDSSRNDFYQHFLAEVQLAPDFAIIEFSY